MARSELGGLLAIGLLACIHEYSLHDDPQPGGGGQGAGGEGAAAGGGAMPTCAPIGPDGGTIVWAERAGGPQAQAVRDLVVDADANLIVAGDFRGALAFGPFELESQGGFDQFVAKLDCNGQPLFAMAVGSAIDQELFTRLAVDAANNIIIAGELVGKFDFGAGPMITADSDVFVVKLDADGSPQWQLQLGGTGRQLARAVAVDPSDHIVVAGYFQGTLSVGGDELVSQGAFDTFVLRVSPEGIPLAWRSFGSPSEEFIEAVAVSADGRVALTGVVEDTNVGVSFGGEPVVSQGGDDAFVAVLDASLDHVWSRGFGSPDPDAEHFQQGKRVAFWGEDVVLLSRVRGQIDFGGGPLSPSLLGMALARFNGLGEHRASAVFDHVSFAHGLAVSPGGEVFVGGEYFAPLTLGDTELPSFGAQDGFFARLSPTFEHRWSRGFGGPLDDQVYALGLARAGQLLVGGNFRQAMVLGNEELISAGDADLLLLRADP